MSKFLALLLTLSTVSVFADSWDKKNSPSNFDENYEYRLNSLPLQGELTASNRPWSSSFWPRKEGSINYRWNTANPIGFKLNRPSLYQVRSMSLEDLAKLSPAEKFDLAQGHYNYPLSKDVEKGSRKDAKDYEGVCDGWTASAIQFTEPAPVNITNPDGIVIPFGSSDVKALMSYDVSINMTSEKLGSVFIGSYCSLGMFLGGARCADINPGAFHVVLANQIGLKQESFGVDVDPGHETWNQPVYGFEFVILGQAKRREGVYRAVNVRAKLKYAQDVLDEGQTGKVFAWDPTVGTLDYASGVMELDYVLELDYSGRIIGGEWTGSSKKKHPDLFWMPTNKIQWTEEFQFLNEIYKPAAL